MPALREQLAEPEQFVVAAELVTSRGVADGGLLAYAHELAGDPRVGVFSVTDNPGGNPMAAPDAVASDLVSRGCEVIVHLSTKDANRNALESRAWHLASQGFDNVLALSGDCPVAGHRGAAEPVFDLDSVGLLALLSEMNAGLPEPRHPGKHLDRTDFFAGCVVTNHKRFEREVIPQYLKLRKKVAAGARFVINQIGFDARKDDELLRWIHRDGLSIKAIANVYVLSRGSARVFHRGTIPGVVVTDELLEVAERHAAAADKGRAFFVDLAAKHLAVVRGLGFAGVYLGGHMRAETFVAILDRAESFAAGDWPAFAREVHFPLGDEFYFFKPDPETGLSSDTPAPRRTGDLRVPLKFRISRRMHEAVFADDAPLFPAGRALYSAIERAPTTIGKAAHIVEQAVKVPLFHCRDCGDCSLPDVAYVCPESICAKNQRNGPCGGTRDGLCEVYDTECIWSQAYERLKAYGEEESMLDGDVIVKDNALDRTSAWANRFLGRDHGSRRAES
ncbi:MAG: methylenetetrahydrofolate reductase C-terminal domain-containing protein [Gaiellaceae bacterium]